MSNKIENDIVSLDTARIAKIAGFSNGSKEYYLDIYGEAIGYQNSLSDLVYNEHDNGFIEAPSLYILHKWLRVAKSTNVFIMSDMNKYWFSIKDEMNFAICESEIEYLFFEDALEYGIKLALSLCIEDGKN